MNIILASSSPRRITLLHKLGIPFKIVPPPYETDVKADDPIERAQLKALEKARSVARLFIEGIIIAADTIVFIDNKIFEKPRNKQEAKIFLKELSGKKHWVVTAIAIIDAKTNRELVDYSLTAVKFRELSEDEIDLYVETLEPLDKAGAYAIQGLGALFVESIEGDFWNVVGFPIPLLYDILKKFFGIDLLRIARKSVSLI